MTEPNTTAASTELAERWRLMLGRYSDKSLQTGLSGDAARIDGALDFLYGRQYEGRGVRGGGPGDGPGDDRGAGSGASSPTAIEWLEEIRELFEASVCERIEVEAIDRFGVTEILSDPEALERMAPNMDLLKTLMGLRRHLSAETLAPLRRIIEKVVRQLTDALESEVRSAMTGRVNRFQRSRQSQLATFDLLGTVTDNLHSWDVERQRLLVENLRFFDRSKVRYPWDVIVCIDQSGSMASSVIHSAVLCGILARLPFVKLKLVVFDTSVVDLSHLAADPVEVLMTVQLGGGTDISSAMRYCEQLVENPTRTVIALITDFYEGGSVQDLEATVTRLSGARVTTLGLAALDDRTTPVFDRGTAQRLVERGMEVAALTPSEFAAWLSEKIS